MYDREETFFCTLWNISATNSETVVRPEFVGVEEPSTIDSKLTEKVFAKSSKNFRIFISTMVTAFMCALVAAAIFLWMVTFEGKTSTVASILLAVQIKIFGAIFHWVAVKITHYENHKYGDDYYNSFLWKLFIFEFVNNYSAFFFMSCWAKWRTIGELDLEGLRKQLATTMFVICIFSIIGALLAEAMVKFGLWWELREYRKKFNKEPPPRMAVEEQAKYGTIGPKEEVMTTMPLMIALGYVLLFGGVSPLIIPLAFGLFAVHMRSCAILYTKYSQRVLPQKTQGIGSWNLVVRMLMFCGVVFSGFLFAGFGSSFEGAPLITRMTGFFMFVLVIVIAWGIIDLIFPGTDGTGILLQKRRDHVMRKLMLSAAACADSELNQDALRAKSHCSKQQFDAIASEDWDRIPLLCDLHDKGSP
jgi:hypothetical protein